MTPCGKCGGTDFIERLDKNGWKSMQCRPCKRIGDRERHRRRAERRHALRIARVVSEPLPAHHGYDGGFGGWQSAQPCPLELWEVEE